MTEYLRKECCDLSEVASDIDDGKDNDDDANSKDVEVVEIDTGDALTMLDRLVNKGRKKLFCRHERQIREGKIAEQKAKQYQLLFYIEIKFL